MKYPAWTNNVIWHVNNKGQRLFIRSRYKVLYGGRASTKSWTAAQALVELANSYEKRVLCTREVQKSIKDSSKRLIEDTIKRHNLEHRFEITQAEIRNKVTGSAFVFYGLKDTQSIKSMEGIDICWIEEGESVSENSIKDVFPTIRKADSEIWITYNPKDEDAPIHKKFVVDEPPPRSIVKKINYTDNPWATRETIEDAEHCKANYPDEYEHIWLGYPRKRTGAYRVLPRNLLDRCVDAHKILGNHDGMTGAGLDLAPGMKDENDKNALSIRTGAVLHHAEEWRSKDLEAIANRSLDTARQYKADMICFDAVGVGGFAETTLANRMQSKQELLLIAFMGGSKVYDPDKIFYEDEYRTITNKDFYRNAKSQQWWNLRLRMENTIKLLDGEAVDDPSYYLSLDSGIKNIDAVLRELSQATYKEDGAGKILINKTPGDTEGEDEGAKIKYRSPNLADTIGYAYVADFANIARTTLFDVL
jgi:phage terminase large subunit